jgi:predicted nucleic acid-binding protein
MSQSMSHDREKLIETLIANSLDRMDTYSSDPLSETMKEMHIQRLRSLFSGRSLKQLISMVQKDSARITISRDRASSQK